MPRQRTLKTAQGDFTLQVFREKLADATHLAIVKARPAVTARPSCGSMSRCR